MAIVTIEDTNLTNIANAIRNKNNTTNKYKPNEMASAIESISGSEDLTAEFNDYETCLTTQETTINDIVNALQNFSVEEAKLQDKTVNPTTLVQTITADTDYDGLSQVTVNAVTSSIDNNILAENIKEGVSILGVTGTLSESSGGGGTTYTPRRISFQDYNFMVNDDGTSYDMRDEVTNIDTSKVESLYYSFANINGIDKLDLSSWNTSNCQDFSHMFENGTFHYIDASNFTFENAFTVVYMFGSCWFLETLVLGAGWLELNDMHLEEDMGGMPGLNPIIPLLDDTNIQAIYVPDELVSDFQGHQIFSLYADYIMPKSEMPN